MTHESATVHHLHRRKRIHIKHEKYPHPDPLKKWIDKLIYVVVILGPLLTISQPLKIFSQKTAEGVSLITWIVFFVSAIIWLGYGIIHKDKPIIIANILWILIEGAAIAGILIYG